MKIMRKLFCNHIWREVRYLHGDEIIAHDYKRHEYVCIRCGKYKWLDHAIDCSRCANLCFNSGGGAECVLLDDGKTCMANERKNWKEVT